MLLAVAARHGALAEGLELELEQSEGEADDAAEPELEVDE